MRTRTSMKSLLPTVAVGCALLGAPAAAQEISFRTDLPRTLVFIQEEGRGQVASREMTSFLREAGFDSLAGVRPTDPTPARLVVERHDHRAEVDEHVG